MCNYDGTLLQPKASGNRASRRVLEQISITCITPNDIEHDDYDDDVHLTFLTADAKCFNIRVFYRMTSIYTLAKLMLPILGDLFE